MTNLIGYLAGFLAMTTFLPQVIKTYRTKRADDISLWMLLLTLAANVFYVIYAVLLKLVPVIVMLGIMSCTVSVQVILTLKYRKKNQ